MNKHCACKAIHDPRFAKRKSISYIIQFARGVSEHHSVLWCGQFIRGSAKVLDPQRVWTYELRPQQFTRIA